MRASLRAIWASAAPLWGEHAGYIDTRGAAVAQAMLAAAEIVGPDGAVVLSDFAPFERGRAQPRRPASWTS